MKASTNTRRHSHCLLHRSHEAIFHLHWICVLKCAIHKFTQIKYSFSAQTNSVGNSTECSIVVKRFLLYLSDGTESIISRIETSRCEKVIASDVRDLSMENEFCIRERDAYKNNAQWNNRSGNCTQWKGLIFVLKLKEINKCFLKKKKKDGAHTEYKMNNKKKLYQTIEVNKRTTQTKNWWKAYLFTHIWMSGVHFKLSITNRIPWFVHGWRT